MAGQQHNEFMALLESCQAHPDSMALLTAMLNEATRSGEVEAAVTFIAGLDEKRQENAAMRRLIREFLTEAGQADLAGRWAPGPAVISLAAHRAAGAGDEVRERTALTFADVGGLDEVKRQIHRRIVAPRENPGLFERFKRRSGGGILLYGPPGCGKTMLAKATAGETRCNFIEISISEILDRYLGQSEKRLTAAFGEAQQRKPAVLFFDEIEALAARRQYDSESGKASLVSTFLQQFDGLAEKNEGVLVLAATNVPWAIDSAFRRPGRFDRVIFVPPPDKASRLAILKRLMAGRPVTAGVDWESYATATVGFSGADLLNLVETAIDLAIEQEMRGEAAPAVARKHLDAALSEVRPTTLEWLSNARNYAKYSSEPSLYADLLAFLDKNQR